jgi:hypothetical protein
MKSVIFLSLLAGLSMTSTAFAVDSGCSNPKSASYGIELCVNMRAQAKVRANIIKSEGGLRVPETGALFVRDTRYPKLGEAYRDPSGIIWGNIAIAETQPSTFRVTFSFAERFCESIGARLPTQTEALKLLAYLGTPSKEFKDTYLVRNTLADGRTEIIPALGEGYFWTSTMKRGLFSWNSNRYFGVGTNYIEDGFRVMHASHYVDHLEYAEVRCVADSK